MNEALRGDGSKIEGRRTASGINAVASRLSVLLLAGPLIKPSIKGMIAADAINEVKRKSAFRSILKTAERAASRAEQAIPAASARRTAAKGGRFVFASITALTKPPRYIWPSPPKLKSPDLIEISPGLQECSAGPGQRRHLAYQGNLNLRLYRSYGSHQRRRGYQKHHL